MLINTIGCRKHALYYIYYLSELQSAFNSVNINKRTLKLLKHESYFLDHPPELLRQS